MKPYLRSIENGLVVPAATAYDTGFLVEKNDGWRSVRPVIQKDRCVGCLQCYLYCPDGAIYRDGDKVSVDYDFCKGCGICKKICKPNVIEMEAE